ncbi:MAG TPA: tetratricopeptide repeat protein [Nannocystaceae bacterium]|nr:tetratricopeptide repeat protein [Nannocystaceae bacterium]
MACGVTEAAPAQRTVAPVAPAVAPTPASAEPASAEPASAEPTSAAAPSVGPAVGTMPSPIVAVAGGADAALFARGEARRHAGDLQGMRQAFLELVRDHPTSPFVPHVFFAFGEVSFAEGRMDDAKRFFEKTAQFPKSDAAAFAHHRIAWCEIDLGRDDAALNAFLRAARAAQVLPSEQGKMLLAASIFDSTAVFARVGKLAKAATFYEHIVKGTEIALEPVLARVADAAVAGGRKDELARACKDAGAPRWCADAGAL